MGGIHIGGAGGLVSTVKVFYPMNKKGTIIYSR